MAEAVINDEIKKLGIDMHQKYWDKLFPACRQTRMMLPMAKNKLWKQMIQQPRKLMNLITQIYTGHSTLNRHLALMGIENENNCKQCGEPDASETVEHYLASCPKYTFHRYHTLGKIFLNTNELKDLSLKNILKYVKKKKRFEQNE